MAAARTLGTVPCCGATEVKNSSMCPWVVASVVGLAISSAALGEVELVKDGRAVSEIVIAADAIQVVKLAALDLQMHLKQMSGAELPIVVAPSPDVAARVYVGESQFTRELGFKPASFRTSGLEILAEENHVILARTARRVRTASTSRAARSSASRPPNQEIFPLRG